MFIYQPNETYFNISGILHGKLIRYWVSLCPQICPFVGISDGRRVKDFHLPLNNNSNLS